MMEIVNIRASSIASILDCPKRGLSIALGLAKGLPSTAPAAIGSACHLSTATFDQSEMEGRGLTAADTVGVLVDYLAERKDEIQWGNVTPREAERRARGVHTRYCMDIAPTMTYREVECTLEPLLVPFDLDGVTIELTGTLDRVYDNSVSSAAPHIPRLGIADVKTGQRVCSQSPGKHKAQLAVYEILYEHSTNQIAEAKPLIIQLQTSAEYKVAVKPVENAREALVGTPDNIGILAHIAKMLASGDFYGNSSSWLCSEKYCPLWQSCVFR